MDVWPPEAPGGAPHWLACAATGRGVVWEADQVLDSDRLDWLSDWVASHRPDFGDAGAASLVFGLARRWWESDADGLFHPDGVVSLEPRLVGPEDSETWRLDVLWDGILPALRLVPGFDRVRGVIEDLIGRLGDALDEGDADSVRDYLGYGEAVLALEWLAGALVESGAPVPGGVLDEIGGLASVLRCSGRMPAGLEGLRAG